MRESHDPIIDLYYNTCVVLVMFENWCDYYWIVFGYYDDKTVVKCHTHIAYVIHINNSIIAMVTYSTDSNLINWVVR